MHALVFEYTEGVDLHEYLAMHSPQSDIELAQKTAPNASVIEEKDFIRIAVQVRNHSFTLFPFCFRLILYFVILFCYLFPCGVPLLCKAVSCEEIVLVMNFNVFVRFPGSIPKLVTCRCVFKTTINAYLPLRPCSLLVVIVQFDEILGNKTQKVCFSVVVVRQTPIAFIVPIIKNETFVVPKSNYGTSKPIFSFFRLQMAWNILLAKTTYIETYQLGMCWCVETRKSKSVTWVSLETRISPVITDHPKAGRCSQFGTSYCPKGTLIYICI